MLRKIEKDGFSIFIPQRDEPARLKFVNESLAATAEYLAAHPETPAGGKFTGTFIYAHPPNYTGRPTLHYRRADWLALLQELGELGVDTLIYQAVAFQEAQECYYPSRRFRTFKTWNALEPLLEAVAESKMRLFLGGVNALSVIAAADVKAEQIDPAIELQIQCLDELLAAYAGRFHGFYITPETCYSGRYDGRRAELINRFFGGICAGAKSLSPTLAVLVSPWTYSLEGYGEPACRFLTEMLQGCQFDILSFQDSVGSGPSRLQHWQDTFDVWKRVAQAVKAPELWCNVETFQRVAVGTENDVAPAEFRRVAHQLAHAATVADKIISWELPWYMSPHQAQSRALREQYLRFIGRGGD